MSMMDTDRTIAELQTSIDLRIADDQRRILERHEARQSQCGEPRGDDSQNFEWFAIGAFVGGVLGMLAGIGATLLVQGMM